MDYKNLEGETEILIVFRSYQYERICWEKPSSNFRFKAICQRYLIGYFINIIRIVITKI